MPQITSRARYYFGLHGWSEADIDYLEENADSIEDKDGWAMGVATAPDGVVWLYPTSPDNIFPVSLWKRIRWYIQNNSNVVIPMSVDQEKVSDLASRYNGYLVSNLFMFGDELKGLQGYSGEKRWSHSRMGESETKTIGE